MKHILILVTTAAEIEGLKDILITLLPKMLSHTIDRGGMFECSLKTDMEVSIWSIEGWKDTLTRGAMFDEIIYHCCNPPLFIRQALMPCNAKLMGLESEKNHDQ